jgi:hypothetical protein
MNARYLMDKSGVLLSEAEDCRSVLAGTGYFGFAVFSHS